MTYRQPLTGIPTPEQPENPYEQATAHLTAGELGSKIDPRWGKYGNAAVIHDWLYWDQPRTRQEADDIFLEGMEVLEVPNWKRKTIYYAVRLFGGFAWRANRRRQQ